MAAVRVACRPASLVLPHSYRSAWLAAIQRPITVRWHSTVTHDDGTARRAVTGMLYVPDPSVTKPSSVVSKLPQLRAMDCGHLRQALFLVTPRLAHWFGSGSTFHHDAINRMYLPTSPNKTPESLVAIVDSLPSPEDLEGGRVAGDRPYASAEGIAICLTSGLSYDPTPSRAVKRPALLRLGSQGSSNTLLSLSMPLANTLFVNGLQDTAFCQRWKATEDGSSIQPRGAPIEVDTIQLGMDNFSGRLLRHCVPLRAVTARREVLSTMGNVVREVKGDDGSVLRASAELEAAVPKILAQLKGEDDTAIQIFARVMPPDAVEMHDENNAQGSKKDGHVQVSFDRVLTGIAHTALMQGGKIYRVQSGGGGWGKKAGLLSLDPAVNFEPLDLSESSMFHDPDQDELTAPCIGALVPAGHSIQFFATKVQRPSPNRLSRRSLSSSDDSFLPAHVSTDWENPAPNKILMGTVAGSDTPQPEQTPGGAMSASAAPVTVLPGHFGVLSEGGVSISLAETDKVVSTRDGHQDDDLILINELRVDVPYSTFEAVLEHEGSG